MAAVYFDGASSSLVPKLSVRLTLKKPANKLEAHSPGTIVLLGEKGPSVRGTPLQYSFKCVPQVCSLAVLPSCTPPGVLPQVCSQMYFLDVLPSVLL